MDKLLDVGCCCETRTGMTKHHALVLGVWALGGGVVNCWCGLATTAARRVKGVGVWIELVEKGWGYSLTSLGTGVAVDEWKGRVNRGSKKERKERQS